MQLNIWRQQLPQQLVWEDIEPAHATSESIYSGKWHGVCIADPLA